MENKTLSSASSSPRLFFPTTTTTTYLPPPTYRVGCHSRVGSSRSLQRVQRKAEQKEKAGQSPFR